MSKYEALALIYLIRVTSGIVIMCGGIFLVMHEFLLLGIIIMFFGVAASVSAIQFKDEDDE